MSIIDETQISTGIRIRRIKSNTDIVFPNGHLIKIYNYFKLPLRNEYYLFDLLSEIYSYNENYCKEEYIYVSWLAHAIQESIPRIDIERAEVVGRQKLIDREMRVPIYIPGENGIWRVKMKN